MDKNDIQLQYRKSMNHNYLVADLPDGAEEDYRLEMISRNNIPGLLKAVRRMNEGKEQIYYEISSLQPLSRIYDHKEIKKSEAAVLLRGIVDVFRSIQEYMLTEGGLILDPGNLYLDPENLKPGLLYIPWSGKVMQESLLQLTEYMMEHIDQSDPTAAMWTYRLYKTSKNENCVLGDIERLIADKAEQEMDRAMPVNETAYHRETDVLPQIEDIKDIDEEEDKEDERKQGFFSRIFGSGTKDKEKKTENKTSKKDGKKKQGILNQKKKDNENEEDMFEMPDFSDAFSDMDIINPEDEDYGKTVFIGQTDVKPENILVEKNKGKQYRINSFPFTIGKVKNCVDLPLTDNSVSRIHARLFMQNGRVYLQDCHSTNGTFINGVQLEAEEQVMLEKEDEIGIGRVRLSYM